MDRRATDQPLRCSSLWSTRDFSIAAYINSAGIPLHEALPTNGRHCDFVFSDPDQRCPGMAIGFVGSEQGWFDLSQRLIKKLTFGWRYRGLAGSRGSWKTADLQLAAWLVMRAADEKTDEKICLVGFRRTHRSRREYEFYFDGDKARIEAIVQEYDASSSRRYSDAQKRLGDLSRQGGTNGSLLR
jgi:hypothetical protein